MTSIIELFFFVFFLSFRFKPPSNGNLDVTSLINFLGEDYLPKLTQITAPNPSTPAPIASQYIGVADGSGGEWL